MVKEVPSSKCASSIPVIGKYSISGRVWRNANVSSEEGGDLLLLLNTDTQPEALLSQMIVMMMMKSRFLDTMHVMTSNSSMYPYILTANDAGDISSPFFGFSAKF